MGASVTTDGSKLARHANDNIIAEKHLMLLV